MLEAKLFATFSIQRIFRQKTIDENISTFDRFGNTFVRIFWNRKQQ